MNEHVVQQRQGKETKEMNVNKQERRDEMTKGETQRTGKHWETEVRQQELVDLPPVLPPIVQTEELQNLTVFFKTFYQLHEPSLSSDDFKL